MATLRGYFPPVLQARQPAGRRSHLSCGPVSRPQFPAESIDRPGVPLRPGDSKGRHTTTTRELFLVPGGGVLIDTPGLRAVGLWLSEQGRSRAFAEIAALAGECRFADCSLDHEPACAVVGAVEAGSLEASRLESFLRLQAESEEFVSRLEKRRQRQHAGRRRNRPHEV
ncbi:MAG: GTPase RsgA [Actinobacteria bacterium]|nr:MAG: GTPase RsgA [Actinomycetota bacterium]RIK03215.1 MAG: hypothetical protein DCC48_17025 [Acidobacteriota bacterium]